MAGPRPEEPTVANTHSNDLPTSAQADGLACVSCGADYLTIRTPHVPVGRSRTGSQIFACASRCAETMASAR